eukprot:GFYU01001870.1.p1 GENE.GFYU01001870.1~~GFYU01001870.1.p1  ORF type:complete len:104 (-),score=16.96 GFYU01001870.1:333-644(-)
MGVSKSDVVTSVAFGCGVMAGMMSNPDDVVDAAFNVLVSKDPNQNAFFSTLDSLSERANWWVRLKQFDEDSPVSHRTLVRIGVGVVAFKACQGVLHLLLSGKR